MIGFGGQCDYATNLNRAAPLELGRADVERSRGWGRPLFVDVRASRKVRAKGFRERAFEERFGPGRYRWMGRDERITESDALTAVYERTFRAIRDRWHDEFRSELHRMFHSAEFEAPCRELFQRIYPEAEVEKTAGRTEHGADFLVTYEDPLLTSGERSGLSWVMVVQVKDWTGRAEDPTPIDQIVQALRHYRNRGQIRAGVIVTMCDEEGAEFRTKRETCSKELGVPIHFLGERRLLDLFMRYGPSPGASGDV